MADPKRPSGKRRRRGHHEHRRARLARHALWPQKDTVALESKMPPDSQLEMEGATRDSPAHWSDGVRHQPAEVLELSPYPWDCVALQFRRNIAEVQFGKDAGEELFGAFAKRLRNSVPPSAMIARWGPEEFAAMLVAKKSEAMASAKWITEHLSGAYSCLIAGRAVRPVLQITVGVIDTAAQDTAERIIERIGLFLVGQT